MRVPPSRKWTRGDDARHTPSLQLWCFHKSSARRLTGVSCSACTQRTAATRYENAASVTRPPSDKSFLSARPSSCFLDRFRLLHLVLSQCLYPTTMRSCLQTQTGRVSTQRSTAGVAPRRAGGRARLLALQMSALACGAPQAQRPPAYSLAPARQGLPPKKSCRVAAAASQSSQGKQSAPFTPRTAARQVAQARRRHSFRNKTQGATAPRLICSSAVRHQASSTAQLTLHWPRWRAQAWLRTQRAGVSKGLRTTDKSWRPASAERSCDLLSACRR